MNDYRILVVDDEEDLCEILKFNLENEGYFVDTANSAEEALKMELTQYNLLLLDVMMGEISGFKMAKRPVFADRISLLFPPSSAGRYSPIRFTKSKNCTRRSLTTIWIGTSYRRN